MKSSKKAVRHRKKVDRPQNRHLRPWKKGDPNIPKSPGRPRTRELLHEIGCYIKEHPDKLDEYFSGRIGKARLHHLIDQLMHRAPVFLTRMAWGPPPTYEQARMWEQEMGW
jgi:hypothetical protein